MLRTDKERQDALKEAHGGVLKKYKEYNDEGGILPIVICDQSVCVVFIFLLVEI